MAKFSNKGSRVIAVTTKAGGPKATVAPMGEGDEPIEIDVADGWYTESRAAALANLGVDVEGLEIADAEPEAPAEEPAKDEAPAATFKAADKPQKKLKDTE